MSTVVKHKKRLAVFILIFFVILLLVYDGYRPIRYYNNINREYWNIQKELNDISEYLIKCPEPYIYISEDNIIKEDIDATINSGESYYILNRESGKNLLNLGYYKISKENNTLYFYKYRNIHGTYGIAYLETDISDSNNTLYKKIDKDWCYFEKR